MPNIQAEVGVAGTRVCKTDVGWIGAGYKYAFDGVSLCAAGIEEYSNPPARRFIWTVEGWAGSHRLAVMWTGDNSGSMDYVRWQITTFIGSGFSAQAHVSGDVDGIFGGSAESYVRDLQFKAFMSVAMVMSGWAPNPDKQPWVYGEPYTTYNRASLKLKARLTPYMYSYCRVAYESGVPPVRAPLLEFPSDATLYSPNNSTSTQFMSGEYLLVAPVFTQGAVTRSGIYLPSGASWADFWDGTLYEGGVTLPDDYAAPLSIIPVFVKLGAIIPMWPEMNFFNEAPWDPMYLEIWPSGNSSFVLYEDDGITREALPPTSAYGKTGISVSAPQDYLFPGSKSSQNVTIRVDGTLGNFTGMLNSRGWWLNVRCRSPPLQVLLSTPGAPNMELPQAGSESQLEFQPFGWYHDPSLQSNAGGLLMIKVSSMASSQGFTLTLSNGPSYPHIGTEACDVPAHHQVENQKFSWEASLEKFLVVPNTRTTTDAATTKTSSSNGSGDLCLTVGKDKDNESHTPALEVQPCSTDLDASQKFTLLSQSKQIALATDNTQCLDQDVSDSRVILYGCHDPAQAGNQAWSINPDGSSQHIVSVANSLCMCVIG